MLITMAEITKEYEISYGHRLLNHKGKCARLHGHNAKISITIEGPITKDNESPSDGMVMDFGDLDAGIAVWLDKTLDHRTILEAGDPLISAIGETDKSSLVIIDMPPTAELLAMFIHNQTIQWLDIYKKEYTASITFWETSKACATINNSDDFLQVPVIMEGEIVITIPVELENVSTV